ncbi:L-aspartate oxidase, partial [bacterium]
FSRVPVSRDTIELRSLSDLAYLITLCASMRKESRGLHYNTDHPEPRKEWERETIIG